MTLKQMLLAGGLAVFAGPALADCADRITFLEEALDDAARLAISASSGGQGVAGAREAQAVTEAIDRAMKAVRQFNAGSLFRLGGGRA